MSELITCSICLDDLINTATSEERIQKPVALACGHCFHETCITAAHKAQRDAGSQTTCPLCIQPHTKSRVGKGGYTPLILAYDPKTKGTCECVHMAPVGLVAKAASIVRLIKELEKAGRNVPSAIAEMIFHGTQKERGISNIDTCQVMASLLANAARGRLDNILETLQCLKLNGVSVDQMESLRTQVHSSTAQLHTASHRVQTYLMELQAERSSQTQLGLSGRRVHELMSTLESKTSLLQSIQGVAREMEFAIANSKREMAGLRDECDKAYGQAFAADRNAAEALQREIDLEVKVGSLQDKINKLELEKIALLSQPRTSGFAFEHSKLTPRPTTASSTPRSWLTPDEPAVNKESIASTSSQAPGRTPLFARRSSRSESPDGAQGSGFMLLLTRSPGSADRARCPLNASGVHAFKGFPSASFPKAEASSGVNLFDSGFTSTHMGSSVASSSKARSPPFDAALPFDPSAFGLSGVTYPNTSRLGLTLAPLNGASGSRPMAVVNPFTLAALPFPIANIVPVEPRDEHSRKRRTKRPAQGPGQASATALAFGEGLSGERKKSPDRISYEEDIPKHEYIQGNTAAKPIADTRPPVFTQGGHFPPGLTVAAFDSAFARLERDRATRASSSSHQGFKGSMNPQALQMLQVMRAQQIIAATSMAERKRKLVNDTLSMPDATGDASGDKRARY